MQYCLILNVSHDFCVDKWRVMITSWFVSRVTAHQFMACNLPRCKLNNLKVVVWATASLNALASLGPIPTGQFLSMMQGIRGHYCLQWKVSKLQTAWWLHLQWSSYIVISTNYNRNMFNFSLQQTGFKGETGNKLLMFHYHTKVPHLLQGVLA